MLIEPKNQGKMDAISHREKGFAVQGPIFGSDIKKRETQAVDKELVVSPSPCCDVPLLALPRIVLWRNRLSAPATYGLYKKPRGLSIKSSSQFCFRVK